MEKDKVTISTGRLIVALICFAVGFYFLVYWGR